MVAAIAVVAVTRIAVLWPDGGRDLPEPNPAQTTRLLDATITEVAEVGEVDPAAAATLPLEATTVRVTARLDDGGETVSFETVDDTGDTYAVAATVNTLFLAYAGAALPLLLFVVGSDPASTVVTSEVVAVEVVRTLVGSIGLIAAVPLTSALAALLVERDRLPPDGG